MIILKNEQFTYSKLMELVKLCLCDDGVLQDFKMKDCIVTGVPREVVVVQYGYPEKFLGYELRENVEIIRNTFIGVPEGKEKGLTLIAKGLTLIANQV